MTLEDFLNSVVYTLSEKINYVYEKKILSTKSKTEVKNKVAQLEKQGWKLNPCLDQSLLVWRKKGVEFSYFLRQYSLVREPD